MDKQIVKSNHVIEASYRLSLNEQRLILLCIQQIKRGQAITPTTGFNILAKDLIDAFGVSSKNAYSDLKEVADVLFNRFLTIYKPDPEEPKLESTRTRWITAIDYIPTEGRLKLYFAPKVIPYISLLESGFTRYNLEYIAPMTSVYGVRFYELFKCWLMGDKSKVKSISLDELKGLLDVKAQYPSIKDFKLKVLDRGLEDVNQHTDLLVSYENTRTGRKITGLDFTIHVKQKPLKIAEPKPPRATKPEIPKTSEFLSLEETKSRLEGARALANAVKMPVETYLNERDRASIAHYELTI
jgi:plasmid replication initiation protein